MQLVKSGEVRAFEVIFDIVQDAFLSLWRSGTGYDPSRGSVRSWVLSVVHNRAVDAMRRVGSKAGRDVPDEGIAERLPAPDSTDAEVERREDARRVRTALDGLPPDQRQVIELAYFGGFTHTQIAEMLDLPAGTVKGRMRLGLTKMRHALSEVAV